MSPGNRGHGTVGLGMQPGLATALRTQHRLGTAAGTTEPPPHCLQVPGPQALSGAGGGESKCPRGVTCFTVSLSASMGFIGHWAPVAPRVTLLRKSGPRGRVRLPLGSGWGGLFARQGGAGWEGWVTEAQPPQAEPVL